MFGCRPELLGLVAPGTARLRGNQVLVDAEDVIRHEMTTLYFDATLVTSGDWVVRNQMFYEAYDHVSEVAYGFSDFHDASAFENKLVLTKMFQRRATTVGLQVSPLHPAHRLPSRQRLHQRVLRSSRSDGPREQPRPAAAGDANRRRTTRSTTSGATWTWASRCSPTSTGAGSASLAGARYEPDRPAQPPAGGQAPAAEREALLCRRLVRGGGGRRRRGWGVLDAQSELRRRHWVHPLCHRVAPVDGDRRTGCRDHRRQHTCRARLRRSRTSWRSA